MQEPCYAELSCARMTHAYARRYHAWDISYHPLAEIRPVPGSANKLLELTVTNQIKTLWGVGAGAPGYRFFLEGAAEFLHEGSSSFAYDAASDRLLYAPADGRAPGAAEGGGGGVSVPKLHELVRGDGASDVALHSLTFQHSAVDYSTCFATTPLSQLDVTSASSDLFCEMQSAADQTVAALHWTNSERIVVSNTTVRHTGGYAIWFDSGCRDSGVYRSQLCDLGAGGVRMTAAHNITLTNSVLEDGGQVWRQGVGVLMQTANVSFVAHNTIRRFYYTGISIGWSWGFAPTSNYGSVILMNNISTIGQGELSDLGCIYHLGIDPGTLIEANVCSDVESYNYGAWGELSSAVLCALVLCRAACCCATL